MNPETNNIHVLNNYVVLLVHQLPLKHLDICSVIFGTICPQMFGIRCGTLTIYRQYRSDEWIEKCILMKTET